MIRARNLQKVYGRKEAVRGVDLDVPSGTLYGFLGPNGAGKTTTIKMLAGLLRPTSGFAEVAGVDIARDPLGAKRRIALVPDQPALFEKLTAREFLRFVGGVYGVEPALRLFLAALLWSAVSAVPGYALLSAGAQNLKNLEWEM